MHHHAVDTLLLDDRFGHTQFVHAIAQRGDVLLQREFLRAVHCLKLESRDDAKIRVTLCLQIQIGQRFFDFGNTFGLRVLVAKAHHHGVFLAGDAGVLDFLVAQRAADIADGGIDFFVERSLHVHLQQKMHAAAQIQAQIHRQRADGRQPMRAARQQVERHHVVVTQLRLQQFLRL